MSTGCCAGDRWPLPIWLVSGSKRSCCERPWRRAEFTARLLVHGPRGRVWVCCGRGASPGARSGPRPPLKGGMPALVKALADAAMNAGAEIRTAADVARIEAGKVILQSGETIEGRVVVSNADPRTTFLKLVDPVELDPNFLSKLRNYRAPGTVAKINLTLSALPDFRGVDDPEKLSGRIHIGPEIDYLERAFDASKYGEFSREPYLDIAFPSPNVMSIHVQFAP